MICVSFGGFFPQRIWAEKSRSLSPKGGTASCAPSSSCGPLVNSVLVQGVFTAVTSFDPHEMPVKQVGVIPRKDGEAEAQKDPPSEWKDKPEPEKKLLKKKLF